MNEGFVAFANRGAPPMTLPLLRPRVSDLSFQVFSRPLHPELFDILAVRKVQRDGYEVTVRITRTGHVITWTHPRLTLTEVAAHDQPLPEHRRLVRHRMRGERVDTVHPGCGVEYQSSFQVEPLPPELFLHVHDEIVLDGGKRGLLHNFQPHHRLALSPLGFVTVEARPGCLFLTAFHTFPDEFTVIKTQSLIEIHT
jgi:hypothetical protein